MVACHGRFTDGGSMSDKSNVVSFDKAGEKHRHSRMHDAKEAKIEEMKNRFKAALPDKPTPVKDYLKKKRSKKKR